MRYQNRFFVRHHSIRPISYPCRSRAHEKRSKKFILQKQLSPLADEYDVILIDCPPSLNVLTVNALVASSQTLVPVQCEYFALEGVIQLLRTIESIKQTVNPQLNILGLLRTMYDGRNRLAREVSEQLLLHFNDGYSIQSYQET